MKMKVKMKMSVVFVILMHVSQHASGVEVYEGVESVLLPCHVLNLLEEPIVVWSRFDLNPTTIHQHQDKNEPYVQNQHYSSRTSMSADALDTGDFSLTLNKPRLFDSGNYTCTVHGDGYDLRLTDVQLQVKEPYTFPAEAWMILLVVLVLLVAALSLAVYLRYKTITVSKVEVEQGANSVKLLCKTKVQQLDNVTVEWNRSDPEPMKVHVHQNGSDYLVEQDNFYRDRTNMEEEPLKTGDLSLTLKTLCYRDRGTYICTVHKEGEILAQKVVRLQVKVPMEVVEYREWGESITLSFKVPDQLPEDATVEWKRSKPGKMMVHRYQEGQHQPYKQAKYFRGRTKMDDDPLKSQNLSVRIFNSGYSDRGTYVCTVHRDGVILIKKKVLVKIKVSSVKVKKTQKLHYQITATLLQDATVEWSRCHPEPLKVHVYHNGQDQPDEQDEFYCNRTEMNKDLLQTGDLCLTLRNTTINDNGIYICTVHRDGHILARKVVLLQFKVHQEEVEEGVQSVQLHLQSLVQLPEGATVEWSRCEPKPMKVHLNDQNQRWEQDPVYRSRTMMKENALQTGDLSLTLTNPTQGDSDFYICTVYRDEDIIWQNVVQLEVKVGVKAKKTQKLHYKITATLLQDATVEWSRCHPEPLKVHVYQNGQDQPDEQDEFYCNRTKMKKDLLQTGDLSLTLRNTTINDNGIYICTVHRDGHILARKVVLLQFKVHQEEVEEGVQSVQLHLQSFVQLPEKATVEWSRCEPKPMKVHIYPNDQNQLWEQDPVYQSRTMMKENALQTRDLSLTLTNPTPGDSDFYICTVCRDGDIIWQNVVQLEVKVSKVEVEQGADSVKLLCKTKVQQLDNVTVEWNRSDPEPMKVHVHQNGSDYLVEQDNFYRDRTNMEEEPLKTGDLSLTLKTLCYRDRGTYICTVHKEGEILAQKVVRLQVKVPMEVVEHEEWAGSVTLPFKVPDQLPEDATVEWKRSKPKMMMVHVYQEGQHQPDKQAEYFRGHTKMDDDPLKSQNLSVRISSCGFSNRGTYVCTVHRDGVILIKKKVLLKVKVSSVKAKKTQKLHYQLEVKEGRQEPDEEDDGVNMHLMARP